MAEKALASSIQRMFSQKDTDNFADFIIESEDGGETKVHSFILISRWVDIQKLLIMKKIFDGWKNSKSPILHFRSPLENYPSN